MTPEETRLLFKDLCARLPYGVLVHTDYADIKLDSRNCILGILCYEHYSKEAKKNCGYDKNHCSIIINGGYWGDVKPCLRPMSSMTDEELAEYEDAKKKDVEDTYETRRVNREAKSRVCISTWYHGTDWLNANFFDYRGLIPMGLALEAPKDMYKIE